MPAYELLKLVKGTTRFYIQIKADTKSEGRRKFRHTYGLNRILSIPERISRGEDLVRKIRYWLDQGNYYEDFDERLVILEMKMSNEAGPRHLLYEAIERIRDSKLDETERRSSRRSYKTHAKLFLEFLEKKNWKGLYVDEFTREHARAYVNDWNVSNNNYFNSKLIFTKWYFNVLVDEEYISRNPFEKIKPRRTTKAKRRNFDLNEMVVLSQMAKEKNTWLWVAIQLAFWGLIRQEEISRLKFEYFDYKKWCIFLSGEETKNWKDDVITLPLFLRDQLKEIQFFSFPGNYFVIGEGVRPGLQRIDERRLHKRFITILNWAVKRNLIDNKKGLSFSSWRRTGMDYFSHRLPPRKFKDHNRHDSFETTERYLPNRKIIAEVSNMTNDVF